MSVIILKFTVHRPSSRQMFGWGESGLPQPLETNRLSTNARYATLVKGLLNPDACRRTSGHFFWIRSGALFFRYRTFLLFPLLVHFSWSGLLVHFFIFLIDPLVVHFTGALEVLLTTPSLFYPAKPMERRRQKARWTFTLVARRLRQVFWIRAPSVRHRRLLYPIVRCMMSVMRLLNPDACCATSLIALRQAHWRTYEPTNRTQRLTYLYTIAYWKNLFCFKAQQSRI